MDEMITRAEHEEFARRMDIENRRIQDENARQNHRIEVLENTVLELTSKQIASVTAAVERLTANMETMRKEHERQGERLAALEGRDGEKWRKVLGYVGAALATAIIGFLVGAFAARFGI